jgi:adenylate cyclase
MALFGLETSPEVACQRALAGAQAMAEALQILNDRLSDELPSPLRMGIGLHVGPVILGEMGHGEATTLTAIGDTVNVASRLEALTKDYGVELVVSADVADQAGIDLTRFEGREVEIRGRRRPLRIQLVASARDLPATETAPGMPPRASWRDLVAFLEPRRR